LGNHPYILLKLEDAPNANAAITPKAISEYPEQEIAYNMRLLDQGGFIHGKFSEGNGTIHAAVVRHMTNAGHELLDTIRSETVWAKTKEVFKSKGIDMTFELVISVGKKLMESLLAS
jgi:hypothetical protein